MPLASAALASLLALAPSTPPAVERGFLSFSAAGPVLPPDKIYVPARLRAPAPLVVVLHGCEQDADAIAASSRWNEVAEKEGFLVLYPNQQWGLNPYNCWNWFLPVNEAPGLGEPAAISYAIAAAKAAYPIDSSRVYVTGLSAGGAAAATMLSCYPDTFAAGAVHSGVAYGIAADPVAAREIMKDGPKDRPRLGVCAPAAFRGGVFVIHGSSDPVINPVNADRTAADFSSAEVREVIVPGLGHAWSGGAPNLPASDPNGPDATGMMWSFFSRFQRK